jgi:F-type H+-transporting ATPase subunit b
MFSPLLLASSNLTEVRPGLIFWTLVTFVLVAFVLRRRAWGPILQLVEEREREIVNAIESAKRERAEAEKLLSEQKAAIAEARREAGEMMRKNQAEVEKFREELMGRARAEAESAKQEAQRAIQDERAKALVELKSSAANLAVDIAKKLLGQELNDEKHRALAQEFLDQLSHQPSTNAPRV